MIVPKETSFFTLPTEARFEDLAHCKSTKSASCKADVLLQLHESENICKKDAEKLCVITEYSVKEDAQYIADWGDVFGFGVVIMAPMSPHHGHRISKPFKKVLTETFLLDGMQLTGTVGGTLGLMIGFSFWTCFEWITAGLSVLLTKMNRQKGTQLTNV